MEVEPETELGEVEAGELVKEEEMEETPEEETAEEASASGGTGPKEKSSVEADAAVGSISHILRTLFRGLYEEQRGVDVEAPTPGPEEEVQASSSSSSSAAAAVEEEEQKPEETEETTDEWFGSGVSSIEDVEATKRAAEARRKAIALRLRNQRAQADAVLAHLSARTSEAALADQRADRALKKQGLLTNAHLPAGPSAFSISEDAVRDGGIFSKSIITASALMRANEEAFLKRSGLAAVAAETTRRQHTQNEPPGYLKQTSANTVRKGLSLKKSRAPHGAKADTTQTRAIEAARRQVDDDRLRRLKNTPAPDYEQLDLDTKVLSRMERKLRYLKNPRYDQSNPNHHRRLVTAGCPEKSSDDAVSNNNQPRSPTTTTERKNRGGDDSLLIEPAALTWVHYELLPPQEEEQEEEENDDKQQTDAPSSPPPPPRSSSSSGGGGGKKKIVRRQKERKLYERILYVRNTSAVSRRVRLLRPTSKFFKVDAVEWPAERDGVLAPGMAVKVVVWLRPEALTRYEDSLTLVGEFGQTKVPLVAYCEPPDVDLPATFEFGPCLLGDSTVKSWNVTNTGGPSRFRLFCDGPTPSLDQSGDDDDSRKEELRLSEDFVLAPASFSLGRGDTITLTAKFSPTSTGFHSRTLKMLAENAPEILERELAGRGDQVEIRCESSTVDFGDVLIGATAGRAVSVRNLGAVAVSYRWDVDSTSSVAVSETASSTGVLDAGKTAVFEFVASPTRVAPIEGAARFVVQQVPQRAANGLSPVVFQKNGSDDGAVDVAALTLDFAGRGLTPTLSATPDDVAASTPLVLGGTFGLYESPVTLRNPTDVPMTWRWETTTEDKGEDDAGEARLTWEPAEGTLGPGESVETTPSLVGLVVGPVAVRAACSAAVPGVDAENFWAASCLVRGEVVDGKVELAKDGVDFGLMAVGTEATQVFEFTNPHRAPLAWSMRLEEEQHEEAPQSPLSCQNNSLSNSASDASLTEATEARVECWPERGVVAGGSTVRVSLRCAAGCKPQNLRALATCAVQAGDVPSSPFTVPIFGKIVSLKVKASESEIDFGTVYVGVRVERSVSLLNESALPTTFAFEKTASNASYAVDVRPSSGEIQAGEALTFIVGVEAHSSGMVDTHLACRVAGTRRSVKLDLKAVSKAAVVAYELLDETQAPPPPLAPPDATQLPLGTEIPACPPPPKLDYGASVPLFERRTLRFVVRNLSAVPARFDLKSAKYPPAVDYPPEQQQQKNDVLPPFHYSTRPPKSSLSRSSFHSRRLLSESGRDEKSAFASVAGRKYVSAKAVEREDRQVLSAGKGVAFRVEPSSGTLDPWGVAVCEVTAFNDMAGAYHDTIECVVQSMPLVRLPVKMAVVGCPLSVVPACVGLDLRSSPSSLSLGQVLVGADAKTLRRSFRLRNAGPIDAQVNWRMGPVDGSDENRIVDVSFTTRQGGKDFDPDRPLAVAVRWHQEPEYSPPFSLEPSSLKVPARGEAVVAVSLPAGHVGPGSSFLADKPSKLQALITASADWIRPKRPATPVSPSGGGPNSPNAVSSGDKKTSNTGDHTQEVSSSQSRPLTASKKALLGVSSIASLASKLRQDGPNEAKIEAAVRIRLDATLREPSLLVGRLDPDLDGGYTIPFKTTSPIVAELASRAHPLHKTLVERVLFQNPTDVEVTCRLSTNPPFSIAGIRAASWPKARKGVEHCRDFLTLAPRESLTVEVQFKPSHKDGPKPSPSQLRVRYDEALTVDFSTGQKQTLRLRGDVLRPVVVAAPPAYDFGLVSATIEVPPALLLFLSNATEVDAEWRLKHVPRASADNGIDGDNPGDSVDDPDVFEWSDLAGTQKGPSMPLSTAAACLPKDLNRAPDALWPQTITALSWRPAEPGREPVTTLEHSLRVKAQENPRFPGPVSVRFAPKRNVAYCSRFRFQVSHGSSFDVVLRGSGTFEEVPLEPQIRVAASSNP